MTTASDFVRAKQLEENPRTIRLSTCTVQHDETVGEYEMRRQCPTFFKTPHGKRETVSVYRGFIIVRNTRQFGASSGWLKPRPERCTQLYIYLGNLEGRPDMMLVDDPGNSVKSAQRRVDRILRTGSINEVPAIDVTL